MVMRRAREPGEEYIAKLVHAIETKDEALDKLSGRAEDAAALEAALGDLADECGVDRDDVFEALPFAFHNVRTTAVRLRDRITQLEDELDDKWDSRRVLDFKLRCAYGAALLVAATSAMGLVKLGYWLF